jgi:transcriptional regulator with XRE-family HTH domain
MATQDERRADPIRQGVGMRLKAAREGKQLSQLDVARRFDVTKATVSAWETGIGDPGIYRLRELSRLYGVAADAILLEDSLTPDSMKFAVEFDSLTEKQKSTFRAVWMAFVSEAVSDNDVEQKMPVTRAVREPSGG